MASIFSRIIAGDMPGHVVFREERWVALLDLFPVEPGHLLLVPVHEAELLAGLPPDALADLGPVVARATACLRAALECHAVSVLVRDGEAAGQEIPHVHVHCIPRYAGDDPHRFGGGRYGHDENTVESAMAEMAGKLRDHWPAA